jgi:hypothetical protein
MANMAVAANARGDLVAGDGSIGGEDTKPVLWRCR